MIREDAKGKHVWGTEYDRDVSVVKYCARLSYSQKVGLQSLEPFADVSDAAVGIDARSPSFLVVTIPASLV